VAKSAVNPATTTTSGWASQLAGSAVADFLGSLAPISAAATAFRSAMKVDLTGVATVTIPSAFPTVSQVRWVAESNPIPVISGSTVGPARKLAVLTVFTSELVLHSAQNAETVVRTMLSEAAALALDSALFDNAAPGSVQTSPKASS
jgi:hypothetical protein